MTSGVMLDVGGTRVAEVFSGLSKLRGTDAQTSGDSDDSKSFVLLQCEDCLNVFGLLFAVYCLYQTLQG